LASETAVTLLPALALSLSQEFKPEGAQAMKEKQKQQEEAEQEVVWSLSEWRKTRKKVSRADYNLLRRTSLSHTLSLESSNILERIVASREDLALLTALLPITEEDNGQPLAKVLDRLTEQGVPGPVLEQVDRGHRQVAVWTLLKDIVDHAGTGHRAILQNQIEKGDIRALSEYVQTLVSADSTEGPTALKEKQAMKTALKENWVVEGMLEVVKKHPPVKTRGRQAKLEPLTEKAKKKRESTRKSKNGYAADIRKHLQWLKEKFESQNKEFVSFVKRQTDIKEGMKEIASSLIANVSLKDARWHQAAGKFTEYLQKEYNLFLE
jgi:hypothetical protein